MTAQTTDLINRLLDLCRAIPGGIGPGVKDDLRALGQALHQAGGADLMDEAFLEVLNLHGADTAMAVMRGWDGIVADDEVSWGPL